MKLVTENVPEELVSPSGPQVGDVYKVEGGRGGPRVRVIVSRSGETCYSLIYSLNSGEITGVDQSGSYYLERKRRVGRLVTVPDLVIDWTQAERFAGCGD